jgi:nifR3 family TIM-barrel protein
MEGITHEQHRNLLVSYGPVGLVFTEFVRVSRAALNPDVVAKASAARAPGVALAVQLMGNDPEKMAEAASVASRAGADVVDINLGCPTKRAAKGGVGAALLDKSEVLHELLARVRDATRVRMSIKLRAGIDDPSRALEIARYAQRIGIDFVTLHPRTSRAMYSGSADWTLVRELARSVTLPVVGNGDLWYARDAVTLMSATAASALMVGRPSLRNPWIFRQIFELRAGHTPFAPDGRDVLSHLERLAHGFEARIPADKPRARVDALKEQITWLARAVPDGGAFRQDALRSNSVEELMTCSQRHLQQRAADDLDLDVDGRHGLEVRAGIPSGMLPGDAGVHGARSA